MMFTAVTYQIMMIWHLCHICCGLHMGMSSTCVLNYAMPSLHGSLPCIFVIYVMTSTSMQNSLHNVAIFRDTGFCRLLPAVILLPCIYVATVRSMLILSMFSKDVLDI